jgi:hypothetical protein
MEFQMNASGIFQEDHWYIWHIYLNIAFGCISEFSTGVLITEVC